LVGAYYSKHFNPVILTYILGFFLIALSLLFLIFRKLIVFPNSRNAILGGSLSGLSAGLLGTAKKKPVETLTLADLGIDAGQVGLGGAWSSVESFESAPPRQAGTVVGGDGGDAGQLADELVEFLASKKFV
jgi:hypothetical protein